MKPLSLRLKGFRGIRDGLGRDELSLDVDALAAGNALVAVVGMNGRGKTTLIENLHPYPVMPSRAGADGLGGFSFYEHLCLPQNEKELVWEHDGRRFRSHQVFWLNGRRRTEAYLSEQHGGQWRPLGLPDGTVSDGRAESYLRCVEHLLGSAETFFTSVFSAQGRRQLAVYRNAEIKTLLADLLGLDAIRALGAQAGETARLLKAALGRLRHEQAGIDEQLGRLRAQRLLFAGAEQRVDASARAREAAAARAVAARGALAKVIAEGDRHRDIDDRRRSLLAERQKAEVDRRATREGLDARERAETERRLALLRRIDGRVAAGEERRLALARRLADARQALQCAEQVGRACRRLHDARRIEQERASRFAAAEATLLRHQDLADETKRLDQRLSTIESEAGQASLCADDLRRRFALTAQVPCAGTDLQPRCRLLGDAHEAQTLIPSADATIARLAAERSTVLGALEHCRAKLSKLGDATARLRVARARLQAADRRVALLAGLAGRNEQIEFAEATRAEAERELAALPAHDAEPTGEEQLERTAIEAALSIIARDRTAADGSHADTLRRIDAALGALPAPFDDAKVQQAEREAAEAQLHAAAADEAHFAALRDAHALASLDTQIDGLTGKQRCRAARERRTGDELGHWNLLAKCLSNDGIIALVIDDAGPALAALANDLLLACYGPRFTLSIRTLIETAKGERREGFDIVVHDADSGDSKSVGLMSGGERTWIDEALRRAIALYLAQNSGRRYRTLFSDEADGALDPARKRMFIAMKREVLRLGGYEQEFFVSQTPELAAMADAVIDLDRFTAGGAGADAEAAGRGAIR